MTRPLYLGIEIGGTKLQLGVGTGDGDLVAFERRDVVISDGADGILRDIEAVGKSLVATHEIAGVGYGFGGPVNVSIGRVIKSHQVSGWDDFPLRQWTKERFGAPVTLGNDCDCAALAEATRGAGRGSHIVYFVTVGTGIGGGLVVNGQLHGTGRPAVAEIGHLRPGLDAADPAATVESLAAGPGIVANLQRLTAGGISTDLTAKDIGELAASGDELAQQALDQGLRTLGWAIAQVVTLTSAEIVVVGGGVSLLGEGAFFRPLRQRVAEYVFPPLADAYTVVPAQLGEEVVVHGAIALAANTLRCESPTQG